MSKMQLHLSFFCVKIFSVLQEIKGDTYMPNIKSAKKRVLVNNKKTEENKAIRTAFKTEIKRVGRH